MKQNQFPILDREIFKTPNGTNAIYEASYKDAPCYAVKHIPTGHIELLSYDEQLINIIIKKIHRCGALACEKKASGAFLKFHSSGRERSISLRMYVFAKYNNLPLSEMKGRKIIRQDTSLVPYNISDLRNENLFDAGDSRECTKSRTIEVHLDSNFLGRKCISITAHNKDGSSTEIYEYSPELHTLLSSSRYCNIQRGRGTERHNVIVHYGHHREDYKIMHLSRFVLLYITYFNKYRNTKGALKRFISDIPLLTERHSQEHCSHIIPEKWNGDRSNIMWMYTHTNAEMSNYIGRFSGIYDAFAVRNDSGEILLDFKVYENHHYFVFKQPEEYSDFQKFMLGKHCITNGLKLYGARGLILLPQIICADRKATTNELSTEEAVASYWRWCNKRDALLYHYNSNPDEFLLWKTKEDCSWYDIPFYLNLCANLAKTSFEQT